MKQNKMNEIWCSFTASPAELIKSDWFNLYNISYMHGNQASNSNAYKTDHLIVSCIGRLLKLCYMIKIHA